MIGSRRSLPNAFAETRTPYGMTEALPVTTHDPLATGWTDGALFLADGRVVDHLDAPTPERVLDRIKEVSER